MPRHVDAVPVDPVGRGHDVRIVCGASQPLCAHGYSSSLAAATLVDLGYARATDVIGGFEAWAAAGLPVVPGDD